MKLLALIMLIALFVACGVQAQEPVLLAEPRVLPLVWDEVSFTPELPHVLFELPEPESEPDPDPVFPNEVGEIMIIVYHGLHPENPGPYDRLTEDFKNDLQALYDGGFRLISMRDLINNNITTPAGYTPVVLSFDDGLPSAFSLERAEDGTLVPVPGTAVYILNEFYKKNPDFGRTAIFFVNGRPRPFAGAGTLQERFEFLIDHGFELGNHSYSHPNFANLNARRLQQEIGRVDQMIRRYAPGFEPLVIAYPFGIRPRPSLRAYIFNGEYDGETYSHEWALRVGNTFVPAVPYHVNFDPGNVARVVPTDQSTPYYDVVDLGFLLRRFERFPHLRFISDGDPNTITVPSTHLQYVNMYKIGDRELVVYKIYDTYDIYYEEPEEDTGEFRTYKPLPYNFMQMDMAG